MESRDTLTQGYLGNGRPQSRLSELLRSPGIHRVPGELQAKVSPENARVTMESRDTSA